MKLPSCFSDVHGNAQREPMLDSVRGIAAITVSVNHWGLLWYAPSHTSVWLFFILSGFLLCSHLIANDFHRAIDLGRFLVRRVLRLYPLYFFAICLFSIWGSPNTMESGWHYFYTRTVLYYADGYLWTVKQEMIFYLILPFLLFILRPLRKLPVICAFILVALAIAASTPFYGETVRVAKDIGSDYPLLIGPFLVGMAAAYLRKPLARIMPPAERAWPWVSIAIVLLIEVVILVPYYYYGYENRMPQPRALFLSALLSPLMAMVLLLLPYLMRGPVRAFFMLVPLRAVGLVGYGYYMWHWPVNLLIEQIHVFQGIERLVVNGTASYLVACTTYCLIEKPFMRLGRWLGRTPAAQVA